MMNNKNTGLNNQTLENRNIGVIIRHLQIYFDGVAELISASGFYKLDQRLATVDDLIKIDNKIKELKKLL